MKCSTCIIPKNIRALKKERKQSLAWQWNFLFENISNIQCWQRFVLSSLSTITQITQIRACSLVFRMMYKISLIFIHQYILRVDLYIRSIQEHLLNFNLLNFFWLKPCFDYCRKEYPFFKAARNRSILLLIDYAIKLYYKTDLE